MNALIDTNYKTIIGAIGIIALALFGTYFQTLEFGFTEMDDTLLTVNNEAFFQEKGAVWKAFTTDVFPAKTKNDIYYRPLLTLTFILDYCLDGNDPFIYHLSNLVWHFAAVAMLFVLLLQLTGRKWMTSLLFSLTFALHPVLTTSVAFIPGRNDSLLSLFVFGAFYFLLRYIKFRKISEYIFHTSLVLAALFTKENAVTILPLFAFYIFLFNKNGIFNRKNILLYSTWTISTIFFLFMRNISLRNPIDIKFDLADSIIANWYALPQYLGKIFSTAELSPIPIVPDMSTVLGIIGLAGVLALFLLSKNKKKSLFGFLWFVLPLLPAIAFTNPFINYNFHFEYRSHMPLLGILFMLLAVGESFPIKPAIKKAGVIFWMALLIFFSIKSHKYSYELKDPKTYFTNVVKKSPHCSIGWGNLAMLYLKEQNYTGGESALKKAIETNPGNPDFYTTLAGLYFYGNAPDLGNRILEELKNSPDINEFSKALKLGQFYIERKNLSLAEMYTLKAKELDGNNKTVQQMLLMIERMKTNG